MIKGRSSKASRRVNPGLQCRLDSSCPKPTLYPFALQAVHVVAPNELACLEAIEGTQRTPPRHFLGVEDSFGDLGLSCVRPGNRLLTDWPSLVAERPWSRLPITPAGRPFGLGWGTGFGFEPFPQSSFFPLRASASARFCWKCESQKLTTFFPCPRDTQSSQ